MIFPYFMKIQLWEVIQLFISRIKKKKKLDLEKKTCLQCCKKKSLMEHQDGLFHVIKTSFLPCPSTRKFHSVFSG